MKKNWMIFTAAAVLTVVGLNAGQVTLKVKKDELREENGKILFEPERSRMKAKYETYVFDKKNFETVAGKMDKLPQSFSLTVDSKPGSVKSINPKEGAVPQGGIKTVYFEAKAVSKAK